MNYKLNEKEHYNKRAINNKSYSSFNDLVLRKSKDFYYKEVDNILKSLTQAVLLDYGCGSGEKHINIVNENIHLYGIDISDQSIEKAKNIARKMNKKATFQVMDCEALNFKDNFFDVVLDFGTLSSLNINLAINEICRVVKPSGKVICIETFGHNPFANIIRFINVLTGKRTKWAASHIMKIHDWQFVSEKFKNIKIEYFGFTVLFIAPFIRILPKYIYNHMIILAEKIDNLILKNNFFKKYAFKTVVVLSNPEK